jgi:hypothetical protein
MLMKKSVLFCLAVIAGGRSASAQAVSIGVKGGIPLADQTISHDESRPYLVGPSIEMRLPAGFAIEADALYQRIGNTVSFGYTPNVSVLGSGFNVLGSGISPFISRRRGDSWEFPLLGKYYFRPRSEGWQPFAATGYAFREVWLHDATTQTIADASGTPRTFSFKNDSRSSLGIGAVFAVGVRFHTGRFSLLPEVRYTRWGGNSDGLLPKNEAGLLLGVSF